MWTPPTRWPCTRCAGMQRRRKNAALYFQKIRAYSDFALEIPYDPEKIRTDMASLLASLSDADRASLEKQIRQVQEDM